MARLQGPASRACQEYHARMSAKPVRMASDGARAALGAAGILLVILVPAVLTLRTVEEGVTRVQASNPTPYGYTISLLLY